MALLLDNGADVNSRNYCGQVLLYFVSPFFLFFFLEIFLLYGAAEYRLFEDDMNSDSFLFVECSSARFLPLIIGTAFR